MRQSYNELEKIVNQINQKVAGNHIQEIWSSPHLISMRVRGPGETRFLVIGRGARWEFVSLEKENLHSQFRIIDKFLQFLRKNIRGARLEDISIHKEDRIIMMSLMRSKKKSFFVMQFNKKQMKLLFFDGSENKLFSSKTGKWASQNEIPKLSDFFEFPKDLNKKAKGNISFSWGLYGQLIEAKSLIRKRDKKLNRKKSNIEKDLKRFEGLNELYTQLKENTIPLEEDSSTLGGFRQKFSSEDGHFKKRDILLNRIKRLKHGHSILEGRLRETKMKISQNMKEESYDFDKKVIQVDWGQDKKVGNKKESKLQGIFFKIGHIRLSVGKNIEGNMELKKKWASKDDTWVHINNHKSSHGFVKILTNESLQMEVLDIVGTIIAEVSGYNSDEIPLVYTKNKFVKNLKGVKGTVTFSKARYYNAKKVKDWRNKVTEI